MNVQAQDLKILVNEKGKVGYADSNGNEVIKCKYDGAQPFHDGTAIVSKSDKYGIIDATGKVLLPLDYNQISIWNENLYLIKSGKKCGLADRYGKIVLPVKYSYISKTNCHGRALVALGGKATTSENKTYMNNAKYGIIDASGNLIIQPKYKGLYEFSFDGKNVYPYHEGNRLAFSSHYMTDTLLTDCSYLGFSKSGISIYGAGIMDGNGNVVLKNGLYDIVMKPQNKMVRYYQKKKKETLCGYHDLSTGKGFQVAKFDKSINDMNFWSHGDFVGDIAPVTGDTWSFVDRTGKILRTGYSALKHSQILGLWGAKNSSGKWEVFNDENNDVPSLSNFGDIYFPVNEGDKEIFSVQKDGKYGCVTRSGEVVIPFEYDQAWGNTFDFIFVKKEGKWGMLSTDNSILIPIKYVNILFPVERNAKHFWVQKSDSCFYHMNISTQRLSSLGYKSVSNFVNGFAHVVPVGLVVEDTPVNRAQTCVPNAPKAEIDAIDMKKSVSSFGYLLNTDDKYLIDIPVSVLYKERVAKEIRKFGGKALSESEKKNILLEVTRENRFYDLKSTIKEGDWNY